MSKFVRAAATGHSLSIAAMEEASRRGVREADLQHLFLALVINGQQAGEVLRSMGITIDSARAAVEAQQAAQLSVLGITTQLPEPGKIRFHETQGYEWNKRVTELLARSSGRGRDGSASAVLVELLEEPSGTVDDILTRLGTTSDAVRAALAATRQEEATSRVLPKEKGVPRGSTVTFVPAPPAEVWALISDVQRLPEWEMSIVAVEPVDGSDPDEGPWLGKVRTTANGKPRKRSPKLRNRLVERLASDGSSRVSWRLSYPEVTRAPRVSTSFVLAEAPGGTTVSIETEWASAQGWRRIMAVVMKPATRFVVWISLSQLASAIGRVFR